MAERSDPLSAIRKLVDQKKYRIRIHAVQHMINEGFNEDDIIEVLRSRRTAWTCKTVGAVYDRPRSLGFDIVGGPELSDCKTQSPQNHEMRERMDRRS